MGQYDTLDNKKGNIKHKKLLIILICLFVLCVGLLSFLYVYHRFFDKECSYSTNLYTYFVDDESVDKFIDGSSMTECGSDIKSKSIVYVYRIVEEDDNVLVYFDAGLHGGSGEDFVTLPKNGNYHEYMQDTSEYVEGDDIEYEDVGYLNLIITFVDSNIVSTLVSSACDILNTSNCDRNLSISGWTFDDSFEVTSDNWTNYEKYVLKQGAEWLSYTNGLEYLLTFVKDDGDYGFYPEFNSSTYFLRDVFDVYTAVSFTWKSLMSDTDYLLDSTEYMKEGLGYVDEYVASTDLEGAYSVNCMNIYSIISNIEECGSSCTTVLDSSFIERLVGFCNTYNTYDDAVELRKYKIDRNQYYADVMFKDVVALDGGDNIDVYDSDYVNSMDSHRLSGLAFSGDYVKGFAYWLYNLENSVDSSAKNTMLLESYRSYISNFTDDTWTYNYYGICEAGNVAMDFYEYTGDSRYLDDIEYIYKNGNILGNNLYKDENRGLSSYFIRESTSCMEFLLDYSVLKNDTVAYDMALELFVDRMNRSLDAKGFGGVVLQNGISSVDDASSVGVYFYDEYVVDGYTYYIALPSNQAYLLRVISKF